MRDVKNFWVYCLGDTRGGCVPDEARLREAGGALQEWEQQLRELGRGGGRPGGCHVDSRPVQDLAPKGDSQALHSTVPRTGGLAQEKAQARRTSQAMSQLRKNATG
jgi:hypothetical protein